MGLSGRKFYRENLDMAEKVGEFECLFDLVARRDGSSSVV